MRITRVSTRHAAIPYPYDGPRHTVGGQSWTTLDVLLVRVETEGGLVGWGEAFGHGCIPATRAAIETLVAPWLLGRDATDIGGTAHALAQAMHLYGRNGPLTYALSGVDIALWDIAGKRAGLPLHALLGGARRTAVPCYASLLRYGEAAARNAAAATARGYRAVKLHEIDPAAVLAVREAIGPDVLLMNDVNCPWTVAQALEMERTLRPANLHWLEEPVWPPEDAAGLARVRAAGSTPIAAGENVGSLHGFRALFEAGAVDVAQPSVTKVGGITEMLRVRALAEAFGVRLVPHCAYFGPGFLASLHVAATLPDAPLERLFLDLEASPFGSWLSAPGGTAAVPDGPGLGCDPDEAVLARYRGLPDTEARK